jgi:hypothetical protein
MSKDETLNEYFKEESHHQGGHSTWKRDFLSSALDRYAMHIVEQSVPGERNRGVEQPEYDFGYEEGHNAAREATLSEARQLTNQPWPLKDPLPQVNDESHDSVNHE